MHRHVLGATCVAAVIAALISGCGGSTASGGRASALIASGPAATKPSPGVGHSSGARSAHASVTIRNFAYGPKTLTVKAGTVVTFVNRDTTNHTVTSDNGTFDLGNLSSGHSTHFRFTKPGTYTYHCTYHPFMHGTIVVT